MKKEKKRKERKKAIFNALYNINMLGLSGESTSSGLSTHHCASPDNSGIISSIGSIMIATGSIIIEVFAHGALL